MENGDLFIHTTVIWREQQKGVCKLGNRIIGILWNIGAVPQKHAQKDLITQIQKKRMGNQRGLLGWNLMKLCVKNIGWGWEVCYHQRRDRMQIIGQIYLYLRVVILCHIQIQITALRTLRTLGGLILMEDGEPIAIGIDPATQRMPNGTKGSPLVTLCLDHQTRHG